MSSSLASESGRVQLQVMSPSTAAAEEIPQLDLPVEQNWNATQRLGFGFLFSFFTFYLVLDRLIALLLLHREVGLFPGAKVLLSAFQRLWPPIVVWTAHNILGLQRRLVYHAGGNSDGIYGHTQMFCFAILAGLVALIWHLAARRDSSYQRLFVWSRLWVRYGLAFTMLVYGMIKVIKAQFPSPDLPLLRARYGDLSPFDLLWNFMGYSIPYTFFAGAIEVLATGLLFFRRTTMLGAMVAGAAMVNVFMLDVSYGVPEKLDVLCLLVMTAFLLAPDLRRLANIFLLNRPTVPDDLDQPTPQATSRTLRFAVKFIVIGWMVALPSLFALAIRRDHAARSPLYGIYEVEDFTRNGQLLRPLLTDSNRWAEVIFLSPTETGIKLMTDSGDMYRTETTGTAVTVFTDHDKVKNTFQCSCADTNHLVLRGSWSGDPIVVTLNRMDESKLPLIRKRSRWINGSP